MHQMHVTDEFEPISQNVGIQRGVSRIEAVILSTLFAAVLCVFACSSIKLCFEIGAGTAPLEKRKLNSIQPPDCSGIAQLARFAPSFERFFDDRLAYRLQLISTRAFLRFRLFSVGTRTVMVGKQGWLFYSEDQAMDFLRNDKPLTSSGLKYWAYYFLQARSEWCKSHGIKYVFYSPPVSSTIYPEMEPDGIRKPGPTHLDQLFSFLRKNTSVDFVDLRPALLATKDFPIYLKTDTHWNHTGAFIATGAILNKLRDSFPNITPIDTSELQVKPVDFVGDLLVLLGASDKICEHTYRQKQNALYKWKFVSPCHDEQTGPDYKLPFATEVDDPSLPTAVCIRDSFTITQKLYLSNHFRRIVYGFWDDFPYDVIEREKPDVVLQEKCERMIGM